MVQAESRRWMRKRVRPLASWSRWNHGRWFQIPSGKLTWPWNTPIFPSRSHQNGGFSMVMLVYRSICFCSPLKMWKIWSNFDDSNLFSNGLKVETTNSFCWEVVKKKQANGSTKKSGWQNLSSFISTSWICFWATFITTKPPKEFAPQMVVKSMGIGSPPKIPLIQVWEFQ